MKTSRYPCFRANLPFVAFLAALAFALPAQAQFATGGSGRFKNNIVWFNWGADSTNITQTGVTRTNSTTIDGQFLRVTCSLSNIGGNGPDPDLISRRSGNWIGDGLDDLYNIGGTGTNNTLITGLANRTLATTGSGTFSCSATFGPNNNATDAAYPLQGLVFADAEQSTNAPPQALEFVQATIPNAATWRIIDRLRGCNTVAGDARVTTGATNQTLALVGRADSCDRLTPVQTGPMAVAFMDGATQADFLFQGGGRSAIALGVMVFTADQGDAPGSYGSALHLPGFTWSGGSLPGSAAGTTTNYMSMTLASPAMPAVRLGAAVDIEQVDVSNATATGDDILGTPDDEDSVGTIPAVALGAGANYTLSGVTCGTGGIVYGYIDFNRDGDFADTGERSASATCAAGTVGNLVWTMPAAANLRSGSSFLRLRIGTNDAQIRVPAGMSNDGEVEDHVITLNAPTVRVQKATTGQAGGPFGFTASNLNGGIANITTAAGDAPEPASPAGVQVTTMGTNVVLTETTVPAGWVQLSAICNDANAAATGNTNPVATATTGPVTIPGAITGTAADITCVFTNTQTTANLSITKTNTFTPAQPSDLPDDTAVRGETRTYTLVATNAGPGTVNGAVVTDAPGAGVTCPAGNAVTITGNGVPAGSFTVANLTGAGIPLGVLAPGQSATLTFNCTVN